MISHIGITIKATLHVLPVTMHLKDYNYIFTTTNVSVKLTVCKNKMYLMKACAKYIYLQTIMCFYS